MDNTFKIFDKNFKLIQTITHNERAILSLQYDDNYFHQSNQNDVIDVNNNTRNQTPSTTNIQPNSSNSTPTGPSISSIQTPTIVIENNNIITNGCIISAGTNGLILWKLKHALSIKRQHNTQTSLYEITKLHTFEKYKQWISNMTYDANYDRIYIFLDRSVHVLSLKEKKVICMLNDIHETPTTAACWYPRSTFYLTACRLVNSLRIQIYICCKLFCILNVKATR